MLRSMSKEDALKYVTRQLYGGRERLLVLGATTMRTSKGDYMADKAIEAGAWFDRSATEIE